MVEYLRSLPPLTDRDLDDVETRLGMKLPRSLRQFYRERDGGKPVPGYFRKGDNYYQAKFILSMNTDKSGLSFVDTYKVLVEQTPEFPRGFLPFAVDDGGDYALYSVRDSDPGTIHFLQQDYHGDDRYVIYLAPSLDAFLGALTDPED